MTQEAGKLAKASKMLKVPQTPSNLWEIWRLGLAACVTGCGPWASPMGLPSCGLRPTLSLDTNGPGRWNPSTSTSCSPCQARLPGGQPPGSTSGPNAMCLCNFEAAALHRLRQTTKRARSLIKLQPSLHNENYFK